MHDGLSEWKSSLVSLGLFIIFIVEFGEFVTAKVWHVIAPLFSKALTRTPQEPSKPKKDSGSGKK